MWNDIPICKTICIHEYIEKLATATANGQFVVLFHIWKWKLIMRKIEG